MTRLNDVPTVDEQTPWQAQKVFNMMDSRLEMFNIGYLAVVTMELYAYGVEHFLQWSCMPMGLNTFYACKLVSSSAIGTAFKLVMEYFFIDLSCIRKAPSLVDPILSIRLSKPLEIA
jgi:hypothetical protein